MKSRNIISIQSSVAYGHVGNSAAVFPLQRLGFEVWPVNTVHFSNHTGYGSWRGSILPIQTVAEVLSGIEERGQFLFCNGLLSGYMGEAALGELIVSSAARIKAALSGSSLLLRSGHGQMLGVVSLSLRASQNS